jgi:hypothetical protein
VAHRALRVEVLGKSFDFSTLRPGDALLYRPSSLFGWVIAVKTWTKVSHVEIYVNEERVVASREKRGVDIYPMRTSGLCAVMRPFMQPDISRAMEWFYSHAKGQGYDYLGLLCFTLAVSHGQKKKMFCSEFATRFYRKGKVDVAAPHFDADKIAPGFMLMTPALEVVWIQPGIL